MSRQLLAAPPDNSIVRRIDARTKIACAAGICLLVLLIDNPLTLYFLFLLVLLPHFAAKISPAQWAVLIVLMLASIWGSLASQAPKDILHYPTDIAS